MAESNSTRKTIGNGLRKAGDYAEAVENMLRINPFIDKGARAKEAVDGWVNSLGTDPKYDVPGSKERLMRVIATRTPIYWLLLGGSKLSPPDLLRNAGDFVYGEDD